MKTTKSSILTDTPRQDKKKKIKGIYFLQATMEYMVNSSNGKQFEMSKRKKKT